MSGPARRKQVAAIVTEYRSDSHAEVILGRLLGQFGYHPQIDVASLYLDQVPANDMGLAEAQAHGVAVCTTIEEAIAIERNGSSIDGILLIGEHGDYPWNEKRQKLYPRRRFFEEAFKAMDKLGLAVPIFNDKHLSYRMDDAQWIYGELKKRGLPFLGGSSIPLTPQVPDYPTGKLNKVQEIFVISWLGLESYGFHGMEVLQSLAEQREGGEQGIVSVQALEGRSVWAAMDQGKVPEDLMLQALQMTSEEIPGHPRDHVDIPTLFMVEYRDGVKGYVLQLQRFVKEWVYAFRGGDGEITASRCSSEPGRPYRHFAELTRRIEQMVIAGQSTVCAERTFLTTGMINMSMESLHLGKKLATPELSTIRYSPAAAAKAQL
ncbi:hypothetical protein ACFQ88_02710 [Paenibacillus sp. NPDC056579]|uniref:hypothetical protein n=1 Tax=Paenibacillus sp. NPDC056579 TaxID=3345871 RepID=UPI0036C09FF4